MSHSIELSMGSRNRENQNIFQITCQSIIRHVKRFQKDILLRGYKYALLVSERNYKKIAKFSYSLQK